MMNNNLANFFLNLMQSGGNPEQLMMQYLQQTKNPIGENLLGLVKQGNTNQIENFARNLCKERGIDFEKEFKSFRQQMRI